MAAAIPWIMPQWTDENGKPYAGGKLWIYQAGTSIKTASYTDSSGIVPNTNPVILDSAGRASVWLAPGNYKLVLMNKNNVVIWTKDQVQPNDGGGGGIIDADYVFEGYSARFSENFGPSTGLRDTLDRILKITYTPPAITLAGSSNIVREKGIPYTGGIVLTANVVKRTNPIDVVRFYRGATLLDTKTGTIPNGGTETHSYTDAFSDTVSFTAQTQDTVVGDDGGGVVTSNTVTYTFVYPYKYLAADSNALTSQEVFDMGFNRLIVSSASVAVGFTAAAGQYLYFAQPAGYAALTSILDANNFEVISSWEMSTGNYTANDGTTQPMRIYKLVNPVAAGSHSFTFRR